MKNLLLFLSVVCLFFVVSCSKDEPAQPQKDEKAIYKCEFYQEGATDAYGYQFVLSPFFYIEGTSDPAGGTEDDLTESHYIFVNREPQASMTVSFGYVWYEDIDKTATFKFIFYKNGEQIDEKTVVAKPEKSDKPIVVNWNYDL